MDFKTFPTGLYIVFEGGDGTGKSAQLNRAWNWLRSIQVQTVATKEPDKNGYWGNKIYSDLSDKSSESAHAKNPIEFQRWYGIDCAENMSKIVIPELKLGITILKDRSHIFSCIYGSMNVGIFNFFQERARLMIGEDFFWPDAILIFDVNPEVARERLIKKGRFLDDFEEKRELVVRVREMYQWIARNFPNCFLIDASDSEEQIFLKVKAVIFQKLQEKKIQYKGL